MNQILDKISKTLRLGTNNKNKNEAQTAILAAQRLMAKYHSTQEEVDDFINENDKKDTEVIEEKTDCFQEGKRKGKSLADIDTRMEEAI